MIVFLLLDLLYMMDVSVNILVSIRTFIYDSSVVKVYQVCFFVFRLLSSHLWGIYILHSNPVAVILRV